MQMTAAKNRSNSINMLSGSIWDKLLIFALPLAVSGIMQQLFNIADSGVLGHYAGKEAMAAVGNCAPAVSLFINLFVGISIGVNVLISRVIGAGQRQRISDCVHTAITFSLSSGVILAVFGYFFTPVLLRIMSLPDDVMPLAIIYMRIFFMGMPFSLLYNFSSSIFRSYGDSKTPMIALFCGCMLNIVLNFVFVKGLGMGAGGVATTTVIANALAAAILLFVQTHRNDEFKLDFKKLRINGAELSEMIKIGLPAGINGMIFAISNVTLQSAVNSLGSHVIAGSTCGYNLEIICYMFYNSFAQAITTFVSQNYGAGNVKRARHVTRIGLLLNLGILFVMCFVIYGFRYPLVTMFNSDPQVVYFGVMRVRYIFFTQWICAINEFLSGALRGYGHSLSPAVIATVTICGVRVLGVWTFFAAAPSFERILLLYPASWLCNTIALLPVYLILIKQISRSVTATHEE